MRDFNEDTLSYKNIFNFDPRPKVSVIQKYIRPNEFEFENVSNIKTDWFDTKYQA